MSGPLTNGFPNPLLGRKAVSHTITGLKRWSCQSRELPAIPQIKHIHVYDFDNTLFMSPLPNPKLWTGTSIGYLQAQESFVNGGWWHDHHILQATGEGLEKEEPRAWEGWWNEHIVSLVDLSVQQDDALTVLLTGRSEHNFADLIKRMVASKNLQFDMICLKPQAGPNNQRFSSTMLYKQALLEDMIYTYKDAEQIRVYEDRPRHVRGFREFFEKLNKTLLLHSTPTPRKSITADVIQVAEIATTLDPVVETAEVQRMVNSYNLSLNTSRSSRLQIKRTIFYTGYLISPTDTAKLLGLISIPPTMPESEIKFLANNILITPRPCSPSIVEKVGGLGSKQSWQITGTAVWESKIWAARVEPIPPKATYHTDNPVPIIVLALLKGARPIDAGRIHNWQPLSPEKQHVFQTVVGEKVQLRVEEEVEGEGEYESLFANKNPKRRHGQEDNGNAEPDRTGWVPPTGPQNQRGGFAHDENRRGGGGGQNSGYRGGNPSRGRGGGPSGPRHPPYPGRGGRGGPRGGGGRGRGRGGYKSLDDMGGNHRYGQGGNGAYQNAQPSYDDGPGQGGNGGEGYNAAFPPLGAGGYMQY